jgi:hypothetical protein
MVTGDHSITLLVKPVFNFVTRIERVQQSFTKSREVCEINRIINVILCILLLLSAGPDKLL